MNLMDFKNTAYGVLFVMGKDNYTKEEVSKLIDIMYNYHEAVVQDLQIRLDIESKCLRQAIEQARNELSNANNKNS